MSLTLGQGDANPGSRSPLGRSFKTTNSPPCDNLPDIRALTSQLRSIASHFDYSQRPHPNKNGSGLDHRLSTGLFIPDTSLDGGFLGRDQELFEIGSHTGLLVGLLEFLDLSLNEG